MKTISTRAASGVLILANALTGATHAQSPTTTAAAEPPKDPRSSPMQDEAAKDAPAKEENSLKAIEFSADSRVFQTLGPSSPSVIQMSERFRDPEQRAALRAEQRAQIAQSHQDVGELLQLDAATQSKLIDLLTDTQMAQQEQFFRSAAGGTSPVDPWEPLYKQADRQTQQVQALRELLGQEKLERYQAYSDYVNEYTEVAKLDARLDPADKLTIEQKQQLAKLQREQITRDIERDRLAQYPKRSRELLSRMLRDMHSREQLQRESQLHTIAANEETWRRMPQSAEQLRQRAADFLTPTQLQMLAQMQAERASSLQQWIENERAQAGLIREIPDRPQISQPPAPTPLSGQVKLRIKLKVNRGEPIYFNHVGGNGEPVSFAGGEGLLVEARATVYDNDMFDVKVSYYEQGAAGKRLIGNGGSLGEVSNARAEAASGQFSSHGGTVVTGNKGYAIQLSALAEPV
jgi:hypothetical protein